VASDSAEAPPPVLELAAAQVEQVRAQVEQVRATETAAAAETAVVGD
jgi:hypothetical protein